jgi:hypothetical protein
MTNLVAHSRVAHDADARAARSTNPHSVPFQGEPEAEANEGVHSLRPVKLQAPKIWTVDNMRALLLSVNR